MFQHKLLDSIDMAGTPIHNFNNLHRGMSFVYLPHTRSGLTNSAEPLHSVRMALIFFSHIFLCIPQQSLDTCRRHIW